MIHRVFGPKSPSRTYITLEDIKICLGFLIGVIIIDLDLTRGFQKDIIHSVFGPKSPSRTSVTLEDTKILIVFLIGVKDD